MDWENFTAKDETRRWVGRPAPRCYTIRNWKHSLVGMGMMVPISIWQQFGIELAQTGSPWYVAWIPLPFMFIALYLSLGHLFWARINWESVFYALTDEHLYIKPGIFSKRVVIPISSIKTIQLKRHGAELATVILSVPVADEDRRVTLSCLEHSQLLTDRLKSLTGLDILQR